MMTYPSASLMPADAFENLSPNPRENDFDGVVFNAISLRRNAFMGNTWFRREWLRPSLRS
jgi:hypothetical protein